MAVLVAVMIMVSIGTFSRTSSPRPEALSAVLNLVMLATIAVVMHTCNLTCGGLVGVLLAALFFANKVGHFLRIDSESQDGGHAHTYRVVGQVFFSPSSKFVDAFDFKEVPNRVTIDLSRAHVRNIAAVAALDKMVLAARAAR